MKKERDSFFSSYGYTGYNQQPNMNPYINNMNNYPFGQNIDYQNQDIFSRINNLENKIRELETRLNKIENMSKIENNTDYNFANSMYMV